MKDIKELVDSIKEVLSHLEAEAAYLKDELEATYEQENRLTVWMKQVENRISALTATLTVLEDMEGSYLNNPEKADELSPESLRNEYEEDFKRLEQANGAVKAVPKTRKRASSKAK